MAFFRRFSGAGTVETRAKMGGCALYFATIERKLKTLRLEKKETEIKENLLVDDLKVLFQAFFRRFSETGTVETTAKMGCALHFATIERNLETLRLEKKETEIKENLLVDELDELKVLLKEHAELEAKREAELKVLLKEHAEREAELEAKLKVLLKEHAEREAELEKVLLKELAEREAKREREAEAKREPELEAEFEKMLLKELEAELEAKREAELEAKREAELEAKREAELEAKREAELEKVLLKELAEHEAKREAELEAKREAELEAKREAELEAKREAELEAELELQVAFLKNSVEDIFKKMTYSSIESKDIVVRSGGEVLFTNKSQTYNTGMADLPMTVYNRAKILNLSDFVKPIFATKGCNILEQVDNFFADKWEEFASYDLYILPINMEAKEKKMKSDLPNVTFAITTLALKRGIEFVIADPVYKGTDASVRIVNLTVVLRDLQNQKVSITTPFAETNGLDMVFYQRGNGYPDQRTYAQIENATNLGRNNIMHMHLVPGKYENGLFGGNCYDDFSMSVATILHELSIIDQYSEKKKKSTISKIFFVLDEFSAYAAYTAVAILGYEINSVSSVLAYRQGVYTPM